jgi:L-lactate permease
MSCVRSLSDHHPIAEVFLIGWAFVYMIEGASGFGTPVALAAPMLVSLGHPPVETISCCLIMNSLSTVYGFHLKLCCAQSPSVLFFLLLVSFVAFYGYGR